MDLLIKLINALVTFLYLAILGRVILDWLLIGGIMRYNNPLREALFRITEPMLAPIRRYTRIGMIDLSPMIAIFILISIQSVLSRAL